MRIATTHAFVYSGPRVGGGWMTNFGAVGRPNPVEWRPYRFYLYFHFRRSWPFVRIGWAIDI
jgi:hypothetical protein